MLPVLTVYSRRGCHLCEQMLEQLLPLSRGRAEIEVIDVDLQPGLAERFGVRVPVLSCSDGELCEYRLDVPRVEEWLSGQ